MWAREAGEGRGVVSDPMLSVNSAAVMGRFCLLLSCSHLMRSIAAIQTDLLSLFFAVELIVELIVELTVELEQKD